MSKSIEVRESGLTKKALALGILGVFITASFYIAGGDIGSCYWPVRSGTYGKQEGLGDEGNHTFPSLIGTFGMGMLLMFIAAFVNLGARKGWWKTRFSQQELAVMMILAPIGGIMGATFWNPFTYWYTAVPHTYVNVKTVDWKLIPDMVFGPKGPFATVDAYNAVWGWSWPRAPMKEPSLYFWQIPWGQIAPMMAISILFEASMILCLIMASMLLRYIWTRVEYLAFPYAEFYGSMVDLAQPSSSESSSSKRTKIFWWLLLIAFTVSFVYQFLGAGFERMVKVVTGGYYPGKYRGYWPDPFNDWKASGFGWLGYDFVELAVLPFAGLYMVTGPWEIGWASFIPYNVLLSALIGWLVMWVIFPLVYAPIAGWGTQPTASFGISQLIDTYTYNIHPDGFSITPLLIGMILAVLFVPLVIHRREALTILKALFKEPDPSFDPDRPIPYRLAWLLMIGGFLLTFLMGVGIMQIQPLPFLFFEIMLVVLFTGVGKIISESGGWVGQMLESPHTRSYQGLVGATTLSAFNVVVKGGTTTPTTSAVMTTWMLNGINPMNWGERVPWYSLYSMKIADSKKVKTKSMLILLTLGFIAGVISLSIVCPAWQAWVTDFKRGNINTALTTVQTGIIRYWGTSLAYMDKTQTLIVTGFVLIFALTLLQRRVSLLRSLSIGGLITGLMLGYGLWFGWLITFVIKYLILKVGGGKLFEEKWKPIALGLFCGGTLSNFVGQLFIILGKTPVY